MKKLVILGGLVVVMLGALYTYLVPRVEADTDYKTVKIDKNTKIKYKKYNDGQIIVEVNTKKKVLTDIGANIDKDGKSDGATIALN
ncbi:hypothetical protein L2Z99_00615 [Lactobacillus mulieris]|uniref:DUF1310 family protein n=1 Tax=Lactobacillus mulieris TaxID=2508708 RepID=A0AAW5WVA3_9LACO|nr:hypothetical protein [Lactobacillus mulieris]KAA9369861.1 hypothetical protein F6I25_00955 [Lactobacillus jensenii]MCF1847349.1 hypothetical protein [Lactobacillus mulieris]MCW8106853.1 hypothetical protein [Lactobacillus mulieris]MCZ9647148.1 hypothetical protein [Lactobacillus mulieris]MCZ9677582.1 hypothetical protein [Lactobacillus mulieris]